MKLAERLTRLEARTGLDGDAERIVATKRLMRLILSDLAALQLARAFTQAWAAACEGRPDLRAAKGERWRELLLRLDAPTRMAVTEAAAKLQERLAQLRERR